MVGGVQSQGQEDVGYQFSAYACASQVCFLLLGRKWELKGIFSVVCCVQYSLDGKFLATGCNRTAQIYDVKTGQKIWCLFLASFCFLTPLETHD